MPLLARAAGIDLGATNTVTACVNNLGHSEIVRDREGNRWIPSAVLFDDQKYYAGEEALLRSAGQTDRLVRGAKRSLGKSLHDQSIGGERFPPELIHACLLHYVRRELDRRWDEPYGVVLTVPAFFGELKRNAAADAGEMAGLHVLDVLNEPTAAALAFGEHTGYLTSEGMPMRKLRALVFNLNAATLETTLLEIAPGGVATLAVDGDLTLGGQSWDDRLADCAAEDFIRRHGADPRDDPELLAQLLTDAERAKRRLSMRAETRIPVRAGAKTLDVKVTREQFAAATSDLLDRAVEVAMRMLASAGCAWPLVDRVLLTGGATQMPLLRARLRELAGREPDYTVHPEEAVARGAALYAHDLVRRAGASGSVPHFKLHHLNTRSLGVQGVDPKTREPFNKILIPRGTPLPASATEKFVIHPADKKEVVITVLEGDSRDARKCDVVGKAILRDLPANLGKEWPVSVTYEYTESGRLRVEAHVCYTDRRVRLELTETANLSHVQRERWKQLVSAEAGFPRLRAELQRRREAPVAYAATDHHAQGDVEAAAPEPEPTSLLSRATQWLFRKPSSAGVETNPPDEATESAEPPLADKTA
jgi:molecular chaperone DnaK